MMEKAKKCPVCNGEKLKWVYYSPSASVAPDLWEFDEDGFNPLILFKRIECANCGATTSSVHLVLSDALATWNYADDTGRKVLQRIGEESVREVET